MFSGQPVRQFRGASRQSSLTRLAAALACAGALGGCAVVPIPITSGELEATAKDDRAAASRGVAPLTAPLSLNEALARALKYNLDQRTRLMEQALASGQLELGSYDMLPKLVGSAAYFSRDKDNTARSTDSVTGLPSLANPSISSERSFGSVDLSLSWNVLDFGLSYYNALQGADRVLIAAERRRKAMHLLMQDVRTAFWRAASAQKLQGELRATIALAESALADSRKVEAEKLRNPIDALRYQRSLMETLRVLETIERELSASRLELAQLINLDPSVSFSLVEPQGADLTPPQLALATEPMEALAVANNADLREQFYSARMSAVETRKAMVRMFPNLNFVAGPKYNDNSYLVHNQWNEVSAQVSWNLFSLFSAPASRKLAEGGEELARQRRMAMQMAVLTQVHLARELYVGAWNQLQRADAIWKIDEQLRVHGSNRETAELQSRMEGISNKTAEIVSLLRRYQALSQVYAASSKVQATLGLEPQIGSVDSSSLAELQQQIDTASKQWQSAELAPSPVLAHASAEQPAAGGAQ